jgi:hypothetical protein
MLNIAHLNSMLQGDTIAASVPAYDLATHSWSRPTLPAAAVSYVRGPPAGSLTYLSSRRPELPGTYSTHQQHQDLLGLACDTHLIGVAISASCC